MIPQSFLSFRSYSWAFFKKDLMAGLTVSVISIPLAMAFAIACGVTPDRGLYTAIVAGFLVSALGGSRYQIGGPTGAFVVVLYGIIQKTGYEGLVLSGLLASLLIFLTGLFRLGSWIRHVPSSLITGFTSGIAVLVFSSQIKDFFGLDMNFVPAEFLPKWTAYGAAFSSFDGMTLAVSTGTLGFILVLRRFFPKIPWGMTAIFCATLICAYLNFPVSTIHSEFGSLPSFLPWPHLPSFAECNASWFEITKNALAIAFLGAIESLLSAVIADKMTSTSHHPNQELIGQGIANFATLFFGGIPATGAIARTAANINNGAQSPVAGMINGLFLLLILLFFSSLIGLIPLGSLSAVLMVVAWNMSERHHFVQQMRSSHKPDVWVLMAGFGLTLFVGITSAIFTGVILSLILNGRERKKEEAPVKSPEAPEIEDEKN